MKTVKCLLVGDSGVGKTSLISKYTMQKSFQDKHIPTVFETHFFNTFPNGFKEPLQLELWDTGGSSEHDLYRPLAYPDADVILICFSMISKKSFKNIAARWYPELRRFCPKTPFCLVGMKMDLSQDKVIRDKLNKEQKDRVLHFEGLEMAQRIGAYKYCECSAKTPAYGVQDVFEKAVCAAVQYKFLKDEHFWEDHEDKRFTELF